MNRKIFALFFCMIFCVLNNHFLTIAEKVVYVEPSEPLTYDPLYIEDKVALHLSSLMYQNLVSTDAADFNLKPELLESLEPTQASGGVYRFKLKSGIQWVGYSSIQRKLVVLKPFTAADVVYTFEQIRDSEQPTRVDHIKHLFKDVRQIEPDEVEFVIKPERAELDLDFILRSLQFPIVTDLSSAGGFKKFKGQPIVGTGPFIMTGEGYGSAQLEENREYAGNANRQTRSRRLKISELEMAVRQDLLTAFNSLTIAESRPNVHLMTEIPLEKYGEAVNNPKVSVVLHSTNSFTYFVYNCKDVFRDIRLRQAFTHAFDRKKAFVNGYGELYPDMRDQPMRMITQIIHSPLQQNQLTLAEDFPILEYEVEKAKKLLTEIADPQQKVGQDIKDAIQKGFKLYYHSEVVADNRICTEFANEIEKNLGIPIELVSMSKSEWFEKIKQGDFQIAYGRGVFNQDVNVIESLFRSGSDQNIGNYKNREIDKLLDEYNRANHPELRGRIRKEMATIIAEDVPFTFLYRIPKRAAFRHDVLGRVNIHPFYFFSFIDGWYVKP